MAGNKGHKSSFPTFLSDRTGFLKGEWEHQPIISPYFFFKTSVKTKKFWPTVACLPLPRHPICLIFTLILVTENTAESRKLSSEARASESDRTDSNVGPDEADAF